MKSIINTKKINEADIVILSVPYEKTASSKKGTINGPKAIVKCLNEKLEFFDRQFKVETIDYLKIAHKNLNNINKLTPEKAIQKIKEESQKFLNLNKFVFLLGGEHSVSIGFFQALAQKYNPKEVTILQIDAHCDLRNDDSDYSKKPSLFAHSCVMRRASELGFNLLQVGIRTYDKNEYQYFTNPKNNVKVFEWHKKIPEIKEIIDSIKTKYLYISIDVDGLDPSFMPGTGTPVPGGLDWYYTLELIQKSINQKELIGADIVEVSPQKDSVLTEYSAAQLFYSIITDKFKNRF